MKRTLTSVWSVLLISLTMVACEKAEIPAPENQAEVQLKKPSGGQISGGKSISTTYVGRATGIDATIWNFQSTMVTSTQTTIADTYFLPASGGSVSKSETQAAIQNVLTSGTLSASTTGQNNSTVSQAAVSSLNITVGGNIISADYLEATATTGCGAIPAGTFQITNLIVNGNPISVTGTANQALYLPNGGLIILNERSGSKKGSNYTMSVTAMHINLPNVADIRVASARADVKCS